MEEEPIYIPEEEEGIIGDFNLQSQSLDEVNQDIEELKEVMPELMKKIATKKSVSKKKTTAKKKSKKICKKVVKQSERTVVTSIGKKQDAEKNKKGSASDPYIRREKLTAKDFEEGNYSEICVSFGLTLSLGNYETVRFDVSQKDFCKPEDRAEMRRSLSEEVTNYTCQSAVDIKKWLRESWREKWREKEY